MQSLCYLDLPWLYLGTLNHPSVTMGDPLTASIKPKTCPKPPDFSFSTSNMISVQLYHSKNNYAISMLSRPTLAVSRHTISPICDHGGPWGTPSQPQNVQKCTPNHQIFFCQPPMWLVCNHIIVKLTMQSLCYLNLPWLCLFTLYHPSVIMGDPLTAPKQSKPRPKPQGFPLSMSNNHLQRVSK